MPSPKFHDHEVGEPVDVSVNCTVCPTFGEEGDHVKSALGEAASADAAPSSPSENASAKPGDLKLLMDVVYFR